MRARGLNKRVYIWQTKTLTDDFGDRKVYNELISKSWAKVETAKTTASELNDIGLDDKSINLLITVRYRNDLDYSGINQFISYNGVNYMFSKAPNEMYLNKTFVKLIATREKKDAYSSIEPINPDTETVFINYKNRVIVNDGTFEADECVKTFIDKIN